MESFLSLPRSAKGGIAVLLAVALLGWAIVAYSAKRQHEDTRSLENTLATLKSQGEREETARSEVQSLQERLTAAETELSTSRDAVLISQQEKGDVEADFAALEAEFATLREQVESGSDPSDQGEALALLDSQDDRETASPASGEGASAEVDTLRARLTRTMTSLSAKNATLQQRERDLARALERAAVAEAEIETLSADVETGKAVRERLTGTMTTLSAKNATLQQRERELTRALERAEAAETEVETLSADVETGKAVRERLTGTMTALSAKSAMLQQRDRDIERMGADLTAAEEQIAGFETVIAERDDADRSLQALAVKLDSTEQALTESTEALEKNRAALGDQETRLQALEEQQASIEALISEKQDAVSEQERKLASLTGSVSQEEQRLAAQKEDIATANAELADLIAAREESAAESSRLATEIDSLQVSLSEKEDAIAYAETELERLEGEITLAEQELAEKDDQLREKTSTLSTQDIKIQGAEASLAALKADRVSAEAETVELKTTINRQQAALEDLAAYKSELETTKAELASQTALLDEKRTEIAVTDAQIIEARKSLDDGSLAGQSLPQIPIAALSTDNPAVLPIDPVQHPFPVQTQNGVRLALVHFDMGSHELSPGGLRRAKEAAAWIKKQGVKKIRLVGATDTIGTVENNMALARRRAQTLFDAFAAEGVDPDRIELISRGEDGGSEVIDDQTAEPLNRCVGVFIDEG